MTAEVIPNPWIGVTDEELDRYMVALALGCGRSKSSLRKKHRVTYCFLFGVLVAEQSRRGRSSPHAPFTA